MLSTTAIESGETRRRPDAVATECQPRLTAVGTAVPPTSYSQLEVLERFGVNDDRVRSLFLNGSIERRHLVLPPCDEDGKPRLESEGELLAKHRSVGIALARQAIEGCLEVIGAEISQVRHLCCVTSTGFMAPGFSALLIDELGLSRHCSRLDVVGMGCNAGLNALGTVRNWAATHPNELALMVCIEVCSASYVFDGTMRTAVVNSLFGDGAAAVAVSSGEGNAGPAIVRTASRIIPEAIEAMRFDWDDFQQKFSFYIDTAVPYVVGAHAREVLGRLLEGTGLRKSDVSHWFIHSGGKKVVDSVRVNLGLSRHDVRHTYGVLRDLGNVSSGSFLFSYQKFLREDVAECGDVGVMMTMGPGSTIEMALLQW